MLTTNIYTVDDIEKLQTSSSVQFKASVPELFTISADDKVVRWVRQLNYSNMDQIVILISRDINVNNIEIMIKTGFDRIVLDYEFSSLFCSCCLILLRTYKLKYIYSEIMKFCQTQFINRQQWSVLQRILEIKKKTNKEDVPKLEKKARMTKRRSFATIYLISNLMEIKFLGFSIYLYIIKECIKSSNVDDLQLLSLLLELSYLKVGYISQIEKDKFLEVIPTLENLIEGHKIEFSHIDILKSYIK
eukprot:NODE_3_length_80033_cov_0.932970.p39 type:complete len:246 gc:universal NODE_3_length_80033_cov_0.932970:6794-7531(+)